jgi:hypothetical protein
MRAHFGVPVESAMASRTKSTEIEAKGNDNAERTKQKP